VPKQLQVLKTYVQSKILYCVHLFVNVNDCNNNDDDDDDDDDDDVDDDDNNNNKTHGKNNIKFSRLSRFVSRGPA